MASTFVEPQVRWLGGRRFWALVVIVVVAATGLALGRAAWLAGAKARPQEAFVVGQETMTPGMTGAYRVLVRDGATQQPIAGAAVRARLLTPAGATAWSGDALTDGAGFALVEPSLAADAAEGGYTLAVAASSSAGSSEVTEPVTVKRSFRVMVTTDKPLYQPGQTIHLRALALATADLRPVADSDAVLEVKDGKGNKVFKHRARTSAYGIVAADFSLADQVNTGSYSVTATVGDTTSEREVTVDRYVLPKFRVDISTQRSFFQPGEVLRGEVTARYTFGEPVARGRVRLVAQEYIETFRDFATVEGETNGEGRFAFELPLPDAFAGLAVKGGDALVSLEATVVDRADHTQKRTKELTVSPQPLRVDVIPEGGRLVPGVENVLFVVTSYPDGRAARARVWTDDGLSGETGEDGIGELRLTPPPGGVELAIHAEDAAGARADATRTLSVADRQAALLLRTDAPVYLAGGTLTATVLSPDRAGRVFLDVVKDSRTVLVRGEDLKDGRAVIAVDLPHDLVGTLEVRAYRIDIAGSVLGDTRLVQVNPAEGLRVAVTLDKSTYLPGETALLRFGVTSGDGTPVAAALGLAGVDEAVFALTEMRPGLERVFFLLQEEILKPRYEIHATVPADAGQLVTTTKVLGHERATTVLLAAAAGEGAPAVRSSETYAQKQAALHAAAVGYRERLKTAALLSPVGLLVLLALPFLGYLGVRLVRRTPVEGLDEAELVALGKAVGAVSWRFAVGVWAVLLGLVALGLVMSLVGSRTKPGGVLATLAAVTLVMALFQALAARRLRRLPASEPLPFVRRLAVLAPLAYLATPVAVVSLIFAAEYPRHLRGAPLVAALATVAVAVLVVASALAVARACAVRRVSLARYLGIAVGRPLLLLAPVLLLLLGALLSRGGARNVPLAAQLDGDVRELKEEIAMQRAMPAPAGLEGGALGAVTKTAGAKGEADTAGGALKEPTRVRRFFPETLLWVPELVTGADGRAELKVPLADSITTWRIAGSAVSGQGELGAFEQPLRVFQDFFVDLDLPVALTQHDAVSVPVAVYNYLPAAQTVQLELHRADWFDLKDEAVKTVRMGPREVGSVYFRIEARTPGRHALLVKARGTAMADAVERTVAVSPDGEQHIQAINGTLEKSGQHTFSVPADAIEGASDLYVKVYPGAFSQVVEGLDSILRMPGGCFEQTSSSTYPNVLVLGYMRATKQVRPEVEMKALGFINQGYQRLLSFEVHGGGFSWFGQAPAHNVLTAYGVLEFADMAKVHEIDPAVLARTAEWLYSEQQADGSWKPTEGGIAEGAINQYQGQLLRTTAYITWALAEAGQGSRLASALRYVRDNLGSSDDPYTLAVCAAALAAAQDPGTQAALDRLIALKQDAEGGVFWKSPGEGATYSRGAVLDIETTAIAAQAMLRSGRETALAHKALAWLVKNKDSFGTWESTQATVHAMRALLSGTGPGSAIKAPVDVAVIANGKAVQELHITPETADVFRLISLRELVRTGANTVTLETNAKANLAYQIVAVHYVPRTLVLQVQQPEMTIDVAFDSTSLKKDDTLTGTVTVRYNRPGEARMTIVDLGVPPGFDVLAESLDVLKAQGLITRYSASGRQVILYFDRIPGGRPVVFTYQMKAKFPVRAKTPASTVYQYYEPSLRDEAEPVVITVT